MTDDDLRIRKATVTLSDGRELMYFGAIPPRPADYPDQRRLAAVHVQSQARWDRLLGEWVVIASHCQDRTFQPADDQCPLCPSMAGSRTEIRPPNMRWSSSRTAFPPSRRRRQPAAGTARWPAGRPRASARSSASVSATPP